MMTPEFINLLTSSDYENSPNRAKATAGRPTNASPLRPAPAAVRSPLQQINHQNADWVVLSSDDGPDEIIPASSYELPALSTTSKTPAASITVEKVSHGSFIELSDDHDEIPPSQIIQSPASKRRRRTPPQEASAAPSLPTARPARIFRRAVSTLEEDTRVGTRQNLQPRASNGLKRSRTIAGPSDPIVWSSSPPPNRESGGGGAAARSRPTSSRHNGRAVGAAGGGWHDLTSDSPAPSDSDAALPDMNDIFGLSQTELRSQITVDALRRTRLATDAARTTDRATETCNGKAADKADNKERRAQQTREKQAAKEAERELKKQQRAEKERDKQKAAELTKLNTLKTDKKAATPEMIVDLPDGINAELAEQIKHFLSPLQVECHMRAVERPNVVKWRRKVVARYNDELDIWEPTGAHIRQEPFALCVLHAQELVDLIVRGDDQDHRFHALQMGAAFAGAKLIYLVEGLAAWMRRNRAARNRHFSDAVRQQGDAAADPPAARRRKKQPAAYVDEEAVEDALLELQVVHGVLIHHTATMMETAEWVVAFTQHIATVPYRTQRATTSLTTAFCMDTGQVRSGATPSETYARMLAQITRVTPAIAAAIAADHATLPRLARHLRAAGPDALEDCRRAGAAGGAFTDRRVGKAVSRRLWRIFTGEDEACVDV